MTNTMLLIPIIVPAILALLIFLSSKKYPLIVQSLSVIGVTINLILSIFMFNKNSSFDAAWGGFGIDFSLRLYQFSGFILLAVSCFAFLIVIYSLVFMKGHKNEKLFYGYLLLTVALVSGAVLANNLVVMLFFWEGLLATLFGMIMTGGKSVYPTAVKAFILSAVADFCLMLGVGMTIYLAGGVSKMDAIHQLPMNFWGGFAFILLIIGATAKAGSMPFHSWIPDAADDAPLPFMAFLPGALEKLLGIYFLARISLDLFNFQPGTSMSIIMMTLGAITIILAVMMALIQKDFKRLLSYHAISQVGYMILGIGTALPVGIVGGLFHMINNAMYKSCLFLTGGSVEKQTGTTDIKKLGGLGRKMPITFICFIVVAAAISGVPPLNGFFSKELIFDGALESGYSIFYVVAVVGAFFTAASFLKLGHAVFLGKQSVETKKAKESSWPMLLPMIIIALGCIVFGVYNALPLQHLIEPILGNRLEYTNAGFHLNWLALVSSVVLVLAFLNHLYGVKRTGKSYGAVDHIHYAPGLKTIYKYAELHYFDPYNIGLNIINIGSEISYYIDRAIDWVYNSFIVWLVNILSVWSRKIYNGSQSVFVGWPLAGVIVIIIIAITTR
jgi:formate hydrogenlyase subunit 3/multisubunit Na+/H+ antiporter MnhD subunit